MDKAELAADKRSRSNKDADRTWRLQSHQYIFIILLPRSLDVPAVLKPPEAIKNGPERARSFVIKFGAIGEEIAAIYNKFPLYSAPTVSSFTMNEYSLLPYKLNRKERGGGFYRT